MAFQLAAVEPDDMAIPIEQARDARRVPFVPLGQHVCVKRPNRLIVR